MRKVIVSLGITAGVILYGDAFVVFLGMSVVAAENDDGVIAYTGLLQLFDNPSDLMIYSSHDSCVGSSRHIQVSKGFFKLTFGLFGVMW